MKRHALTLLWAGLVAAAIAVTMGANRRSISPDTALPGNVQIATLHSGSLSIDDFNQAKALARELSIIPPSSSEYAADQKTWDLIYLIETLKKGGQEPDPMVPMNTAWVKNFFEIRQVDTPEKAAEWTKTKFGLDLPAFTAAASEMMAADELIGRLENSKKVVVSDEEVLQRFLDQNNALGLEMVFFTTPEEAQRYIQENPYEVWMKKRDEDYTIYRSTGLVSLESLMETWGISREDLYGPLMQAGGGVVPTPIRFRSGIAAVRIESRTEAQPESLDERKKIELRESIQKKRLYENYSLPLQRLLGKAEIQPHVPGYFLNLETTVGNLRAYLFYSRFPKTIEAIAKNKNAFAGMPLAFHEPTNTDSPGGFYQLCLDSKDNIVLTRSLSGEDSSSLRVIGEIIAGEAEIETALSLWADSSIEKSGKPKIVSATVVEKPWRPEL